MIFFYILYTCTLCMKTTDFLSYFDRKIRNHWPFILVKLKELKFLLHLYITFSCKLSPPWKWFLKINVSNFASFSFMTKIHFKQLKDTFFTSFLTLFTPCKYIFVYFCTIYPFYLMHKCRNICVLAYSSHWIPSKLLEKLSKSKEPMSKWISGLSSKL